MVICFFVVICSFSQRTFYNLLFQRKEDTHMKKYFAPEMETLNFAAEEAIAGLLGRNLFNDAEFGGW